MKIKLLSILVASSIGAATPALAADNAAIMKRLDQLEAQRQADQSEIQSLRSKIQQLEAQKFAPVSSTEAAQLREEIVKVDKKASQRIDSVKKSIQGDQDKLKINGYMSVYGVKSTNEAATLGSGIDNHIGFNSDTIAGIQFDYRLDEKIDAVVQLQAEGKDDYSLETPWAFLRYKLAPSTTLRAGRMVAPLYLYADSIDVGYTYAWVRPPVEMYNTERVQYTGVDLIHNFDLAGWDSSVQILFGDNDGNTNGAELRGDYTTGIALTFNNDAWTLRLADNYTANLSVNGLDNFADSVTYLSASVRYDNGALLVLAEGRRIEAGALLEALVSDSDGFYATIGYQINNFMPYATWAKAYSVEENLLPGVLPQTQESIGLGVRYNLTDKVVVKGEATQYDGFNGTSGVSGFATLPTNPVARADALQKLDEDGATVMSLGIDAVF